MKWVWILSLFLLVPACSSLRKKYTGDPFQRTLLFPPGTYEHRVEIVPVDATPQSFKGIVRISPDKIIVVGLAAFDATVFRITEDRKTKQISSQIFSEILQKHEDKILDFYSILRRLFLIRYPSAPELTLNGRSYAVRIRLLDSDPNGMPSRIEMDHEKFKVNIQVSGYEI